jgi:hypothetical protein
VPSFYRKVLKLSISDFVNAGARPSISQRRVAPTVPFFPG